jgi:hypothetical protein
VPQLSLSESRSTQRPPQHVIVLADLVAAAAVVGASYRVHALPAAARRARAPRSEAHGGRLLGTGVRRQRRVSKQETAPPGMAACSHGGAGISDLGNSCGSEHREEKGDRLTIYRLKYRLHCGRYKPFQQLIIGGYKIIPTLTIFC